MLPSVASWTLLMEDVVGQQLYHEFRQVLTQVGLEKAVWDRFFLQCDDAIQTSEDTATD